VAQTSCHSHLALTRPCKDIWRKLRQARIWPKTGSTVAFRPVIRPSVRAVRIRPWHGRSGALSGPPPVPIPRETNLGRFSPGKQPRSVLPGRFSPAEPRSLLPHQQQSVPQQSPPARRQAKPHVKAAESSLVAAESSLVDVASIVPRDCTVPPLEEERNATNAKDAKRSTSFAMRTSFYIGHVIGHSFQAWQSTVIYRTYGGLRQ